MVAATNLMFCSIPLKIIPSNILYIDSVKDSL